MIPEAFISLAPCVTNFNIRGEKYFSLWFKTEQILDGSRAETVKFISLIP